MAQTEKSSLKAFEADVSGLEFNGSDLIKDATSLRISENLKSYTTEGLSKREGFEAVGGNGLLLGIDTYNYQDRTSGASKEELIGFGQHIFKFTSATATITRTSGTFYIDFNRATTTVRLINNLGGTDLTFFYTPSNYNVGSMETYHIGQFLKAVLATGLYTLTLSHPGEVIDGSATLGTINAAITVSGLFGGLNRGISYTVYDDEKGLLSYLPITARTSSTVARTNCNSFPFKVRDKAGIGSLTGWIESVTDYGTNTLAASKQLTWRFWDGISTPCLFDPDNVMASTSTYGTRVGLFSDFAHQFWRLNTEASYPMIKPINMNNKFYFSCPYLNDASTGYSPIITNQDVDGLGKLYCYDGKSVYRAGIPSPALGGIEPSATGGVSVTPSVANGQWKYMTTFVYLDANGVEWESNPSSIQTNNTGGTGAGTTVVSAYPSTAGMILGHQYFDFRACKIVLGATGTTFQIKGRSAVPSIPEIRVGDRLWDAYPTSTTKPYIVTAVSYNGANPTITIDRSATFATNAVLSTGMFVRTYRTKQYGTIFAQLSTRPVMVNDLTYSTFTDTTPDSSLVLQYIEPISGQEHDLPPITGNLCSHQGNLISGGSTYEPNTVYWSGIDGIEYWPRAFNSTDIPSTTFGAITALGTTRSGALAVLKATGYYSIDGDLASANISIRTINEGDYGVGSQRGLTRIGDTLVGVGKRGVMLIDDGIDIKSIGQVNAAIRDNDSWDIAQAFCYNDYLNNQLIVAIPIKYASSVPVNSPNSHLTLTYDYEAPKWGTLTFYNSQITPNFCDMSGGFTTFENNLYVMSRCGIATNGSESTYLAVGSANFTTLRGSGAVYKQKSATSALGFNDFGSSIRARLRTSFDSLGEPSQYKLIHRVRVWRIPSQYALGASFYNVEYIPEPMDVFIKTYADWFAYDDFLFPTITKTSYIGKTFPAYTGTLSSASSTACFVELPLKDGKMRSIAVEIENNTLNQGFYITGYEVIYSVPTASESKFGGSNPRV